MCSSNYEKILIPGDFNVSVKGNRMKWFCNNYGPKYLIKQPIYYKNSDNPTDIDLILTNVPLRFYSLWGLVGWKVTWGLETGLSDFHLMTVTVVIEGYKPRIFNFQASKTSGKTYYIIYPK